MDSTPNSDGQSNWQWWTVKLTAMDSQTNKQKDWQTDRVGAATCPSISIGHAGKNENLPPTAKILVFSSLFSVSYDKVVQAIA